MSGKHEKRKNIEDAIQPETEAKPPPPTLKPFLDNLPEPQSLTTTKVNVNQRQYHHPLVANDDPTPTKPMFDLGTNDGWDDEEEKEVDDEEEFESHYSRQSSPASSANSDEEDEPDEERDEDGLSQVQRVSSMPASAAIDQQHVLRGGLHMSKSTTALGFGPPPVARPLYPPLYNKPQTPLPPSPSLISLLRPPSLRNQSTTSTRGPSPDSSDVETPNDTEAQVAQQARRANPVPPTVPKVPTYEYYGFVLYLASSLAFLMYILWSYLPSPFLHALGITYYPDRWWALAIPAWIVMVLIYIYVALACYNVEYLTLGLQRVETIVDDASSVAVLDENGRIRKGGSKRFVAEIEERRRREAIVHSWDRKKKGGSSGGRGSKKKDKKEKDKVDECYGYMGEVTENGVASGLSWRQVWNEGTDAVMDVPLGGVCEVLYGEGRDML